MKKLYTFAALAAMSLSATLAASAAPLRSVDAVLSPATNVERVPVTRHHHLGAPVTSSISVKEAGKPIKAPAKAETADTEWEALGEAQFTDGLLFAAYGSATGNPYAVQAYQSKTDKNVYKLENIYPLSYLDDPDNKFEDGTPVYTQTDNKPSSVILTVNEDRTVLAEFDLNLTLTELNAATSVNQVDYGRFTDGTFDFPNRCFIVYYGGQPYVYNTPFNVVLPGAKDYDLSIGSSNGDVCSSNNFVGFWVNAGKDTAAIKYFLTRGIFPASQENFEFVAQEGKDLDITDNKVFNFNLADSEPGWLTLFVTTLNEAGEYMVGKVLYFYLHPEFDPEEWASLGMVKYNDAIFATRNSPEEIYDVELYQSKTDPSKIAVANMFYDHPYAAGWINSDHDHYLYIDLNELTNVSIDIQPIGVKYNTVQNYSLGSIAAGTLKDGVLTFPVDGLVYYLADMTGYYANRDGRFSLEVPDFLTVKVTVDGTPVENAFVNYADWSGEGVYTNAEGIAYMPVKPGSTEFMAYKDGYETTTFTADAQGRILSAETELTPAPASFSIWVRDADEEPIAEAYVTFMEQEYYTDENGELKVTGLNGPDVIGKTFPFTVYKDGYEPFEGEADFTETLDALRHVTLTASVATFSLWVRDAEEEPVADVNVYFMDKEYTTNANGELKVTGISGPAVIGKTVPFSAYKDGYDPLEGEADFTETLDALENITLVASSATLTVIVSDVDGEPVEGATVTFMDQKVTTTENGNAVFTGIAGPAVIGQSVPFTAAKNGYVAANGEADFTETLDAYGFATLVAAEASLTVTVTDTDKKALADAYVTFMGQEAYTNEEGSAYFGIADATEVADKEVEFTAYKDGYEPFEGKADFTEGLEATATAELTAAEATLTVLVLGLDEAPVENATVTFNDEEVLTGEDGKAVFTGIAGPEVMGQKVPYTVNADGYDTYQGEADFTESLEVMPIAQLTESKATLTVQVFDSEDEPLEGAFVEILDHNGTTDANGRAVITGIPALSVLGTNATFTARKDGYETTEGTADFTEGIEAYGFVTLKAAEATMTVIVLGLDEEPVEGAYVTFNGEDKTTGEDGKAVFTGIAGPDVIGKMVPYTVYADGYDPFEGEADFTEGLEAMPIAQLTEAEATLTIMLFGVDDEPLADAWVWFLDFETKTDANGNAEITGIPALSVLGKKVPYSAYKDGYEFYDGEVDFTETLNGYAFATLTEAMATLDVIVLNENDEIVGNATVTFLDQEYTTDENGKLTINNIPALSVIGTEVPVTVTAPEYKEWKGVADFTEGIEITVIATLIASDGIAAIIRDIENGDTKVYDLNGRRVLNPANGHIYIVNGVKVRFNR